MKKSHKDNLVDMTVSIDAPDLAVQMIEYCSDETILFFLQQLIELIKENCFPNRHYQILKFFAQEIVNEIQAVENEDKENKDIIELRKILENVC